MPDFRAADRVPVTADCHRPVGTETGDTGGGHAADTGIESSVRVRHHVGQHGCQIRFVNIAGYTGQTQKQAQAGRKDQHPIHAGIEYAPPTQGVRSTMQVAGPRIPESKGEGPPARGQTGRSLPTHHRQQKIRVIARRRPRSDEVTGIVDTPHDGQQATLVMADHGRSSNQRERARTKGPTPGNSGPENLREACRGGWCFQTDDAVSREIGHGANLTNDLSSLPCG